MESKSIGMGNTIILSELYEALTKRHSRKMVMNRDFIFMITKYGTVKISKDYTMFPGNDQKYGRNGKSVEEYSSFIFTNIDRLSMPLWKVEKIFNEVTSGKWKILHGISKRHGFLLLNTPPFGYTYFNGNECHFPNYYKMVCRGDMSLESFCKHISDNVETYNRSNIHSILSEHHYEVKTVKITSWNNNDPFKNGVRTEWHVTTQYGNVIAGEDIVKFPGNPNVYYRKNKSMEDFATFIMEGIDKFSDLSKNIIADISDEDIIGKKIEDIHSNWNNLLDSFYTFYSCLQGCTFNDMGKCARIFRRNNKAQIQFLRDSFADTVYAQTKQYADIFNLPIKELRIRKSYRFLGLCHPNEKTIDIAFRCINLPVNFIREVILHELCHLFFLDHNLKFHRKLEEMCYVVGLIKKSGYIVPELYYSRTNATLRIIFETDCYKPIGNDLIDTREIKRFTDFSY